MSRVAILVGLLFVCCVGILRGQTTNASIGGRVTDPSKAVIRDAKVAAINAGTNVRYEGATNDAGQYYLANLPSGAYRIEIEKTGFKKLIKPLERPPLTDGVIGNGDDREVRARRACVHQDDLREPIDRLACTRRA